MGLRFCKLYKYIYISVYINSEHKIDFVLDLELNSEKNFRSNAN